MMMIIIIIIIMIICTSSYGNKERGLQSFKVLISMQSVMLVGHASGFQVTMV